MKSPQKSPKSAKKGQNDGEPGTSEHHPKPSRFNLQSWKDYDQPTTAQVPLEQREQRWGI